MLQVSNLSKRFGGITAVDCVSLEVHKGEIVGLIGPNGAGKTTLINLVSGFYKPDDGRIIFEKVDITKKRMDERVKLGIARTFQIPRVISNMTVLQNVVYAVIGSNRFKEKKMTLSEAAAESLYYLDIVGLLRKRDVLCKDLPIYELRLLELARALALNPKFVMVDEAMAGLNPAEADNVAKLVHRLREEFDLTIIWVEHVLRIIMKSVERVVVMNEGKVIADGKPHEVARDVNVIKAYMGEEVAVA
ncbi:MAG: ABC transporter ATP-binding protein [Candidatus Nezhaarchaeota archaeon]|nr:ABC transporter ATP-binding protein [Candidatus Nezhaarchaeota archaeon]